MVIVLQHQTIIPVFACFIEVKCNNNLLELLTTQHDILCRSCDFRHFFPSLIVKKLQPQITRKKHIGFAKSIQILINVLDIICIPDRNWYCQEIEQKIIAN